MTARTHDAFAFASLVTVAAFYPPEHITLASFVGAIIACDIGALIPDMDGAGNRLWDFLPQGQKLGRILRHIFYKHRTITHSLLGVYVVYRILDWGLPKIFNSGFIDSRIILISAMVGYLSHLLADGLTEEGLPLLSPFKFKFGFPPISSWRITTGSWFEKLVVLPAIAVYLVWFIHLNSEKLLTIIRRVGS